MLPGLAECRDCFHEVPLCRTLLGYVRSSIKGPVYVLVGLPAIGTMPDVLLCMLQ